MAGDFDSYTGKPAKEAIGDEKWYKETFIPLIQARILV